MDAIATLLFGYFNDSVPIQIGRGISKIDGERRTQGVLGFGIRISIDCCSTNPVLRCRSSYPSANKFYLYSALKLVWKESYNAISPRLAINIEVNGVVAEECFAEVEDSPRLETEGVTWSPNSLGVRDSFAQYMLREGTTVSPLPTYSIVYESYILKSASIALRYA